MAPGLEGDTVLLREGEQGLGGFLREEGHVDLFPGEGALAGAAEQEQGLGEVDRPGVHGVEAVDDLAGVLVRVGAGHVEDGLRDGQRGAQLVRGVGREAPLFGHVGFEAGEHLVEGIGEFSVLVPAARQPDAVGEGSGRRRAGGLGDAVQGASMRPARNQPPTRPNTRRNAMTQAAGAKLRRKTVPGVALTAPRSLVSNQPWSRRNTPTATSSRTPASVRNPA